MQLVQINQLNSLLCTDLLLWPPVKLQQMGNCFIHIIKKEIRFPKRLGGIKQSGMATHTYSPWADPAGASVTA